MMEQLSNPIIAVFSRRSIMICSPLIKSPYFAQLRPIIVLTIKVLVEPSDDIIY